MVQVLDPPVPLRIPAALPLEPRGRRAVDGHGGGAGAVLRRCELLGVVLLPQELRVQHDRVHPPPVRPCPADGAVMSAAVGRVSYPSKNLESLKNDRDGERTLTSRVRAA